MGVNVSSMAAPVMATPSSTVRQTVSATRFVFWFMNPVLVEEGVENLHHRSTGPPHHLPHFTIREPTSCTLKTENPHSSLKIARSESISSEGKLNFSD